MKGMLTVGILMLTVFLLSAPAQAGTDAPYVVIGQAIYPDGAPADGAVATVYVDGDPSRSTTGVVGVSYSPDAPDLWKVDLYNIEGSIEDGTAMVVSIDDGDSNVGRTTFVVDTSSVGVHRVADVTLAPAETGSGGGGGSGTYPPGWGETKTLATGPAATSTDDTSSDSTGTEGSTGEKTVATGGGSTKGTTTGGSTDGTTEPTDDNASENTGDTGDTGDTTEMKTPGFGAFFAVVGMLAVAFMALRRRD
ncbi:MAG: PGF-CTERM sorting domain-containing protein [Euryarchaeota archaeon]|nr:PGF-CTERM sorting domain-containing protein [Euryarchaeota archaeon]